MCMAEVAWINKFNSTEKRMSEECVERSATERNRLTRMVGVGRGGWGVDTGDGAESVDKSSVGLCGSPFVVFTDDSKRYTMKTFT